MIQVQLLHFYVCLNNMAAITSILCCQTKKIFVTSSPQDEYTNMELF